MTRVFLQSLLRLSREVPRRDNFMSVAACGWHDHAPVGEIDEAGHGPFSQVGFSRLLIS